MTDSAEKWDARYRAGDGRPAPPAQVLSENRHLLPDSGRALDLACGLGGNALLLAEAGLETAAWDISAVALEKLSAEARARSLSVTTCCCDLSATALPRAQFDVIVVSRFLERALSGPICQALTPGGVLFYQTFTREKTTSAGPSDPRFLLGANELLRLFAGLRVLAFRDEGRQGDVSTGLRNESWIVAKKEELQ
ncbi:class I SAM-dependent methyltransferase [Granulosicoccaceae sp. 1_MG-2023]|nr:class I SAM-dependent methyltransferase [Granulosicoccaceae sp. 1_MG-2023]